jgi:hypothetical protein
VCKERERERESEVLAEGQVCSLFVRFELVYVKLLSYNLKPKLMVLIAHHKQVACIQLQVIECPIVALLPSLSKASLLWLKKWWRKSCSID